MQEYPGPIVSVNHSEPVPRRIRATVGARTVIDTTSARYVWEWPNFPQYYIPFEDFAEGALVDEDHTEHLSRGTAERYGLSVEGVVRNGVAHRYRESDIDGLAGLVRIDWRALDHWFEEDEEVFVHPHDPCCASTPCARPAPSASSSKEQSWPGRLRRSWSLRPDCRPATTSTAPR